MRACCKSGVSLKVWQKYAVPVDGPTARSASGAEPKSTTALRGVQHRVRWPLVDQCHAYEEERRARAEHLRQRRRNLYRLGYSSSVTALRVFQALVRRSPHGKEEA